MRKKYLFEKRQKLEINNRLSDSEDRYVSMSKINSMKSRQEPEDRNKGVTMNRYEISNELGHTYASLKSITRVQEGKFERSKDVYYEVMQGRVWFQQ